MTPKRSERAAATRVTRRFAKNLASRRRRSDLSQAKAAERSGLHHTEISLLERGLRVPRLDTIVQVAAGVEAEPCELLAGMVWRLDRRRLHDRDVPPGCFEVKVGNRWVAA
ncbi:MAG: helix-turn-helix transcriptional regulator [Solirubrobacterales bacterium]|nr:helix-turn-helix transcriptional regulator [Solirubrobacterales bacterium]